MSMGSAPSVSITKSGTEPARDMSRIISRVHNLKAAIEKPTVKDGKRKLLQSELDKLMTQVGGLKSALEEL